MLKGEGLSKTIPGFRPTGALRATKFAPGEFVEPSNDASRRESSNPGAASETQNPADAGFCVSGGGCSLLRTGLCPNSLLWRENTGKISHFQADLLTYNAKNPVVTHLCPN